MMNKHSERLKMLGNNVKSLEEKLQKVIKGSEDTIHEDRKVISNRNTSVEHIPPNLSIEKDSVLNKGKPRASVEVTVQAKRFGKSRKKKSVSISSESPALANAHVGFESHPEHSRRRLPSRNKGNLMWSDILKDNVTFAANAASKIKDGEEFLKRMKEQRNESGDKKVGNLFSCPNCKNLLPGRTCLTKLEEDSRKIADLNPIKSSCEVACQVNMKIPNYGTQFPNEVYPEIKCKVLNGSKCGTDRNPIEKLSMLLRELNEKMTVEDESLQKLVRHMQIILGNIMDAMSSDSGYRALLVGKLSCKGMIEQDSKHTKGTGNKRNYNYENAEKNKMILKNVIEKHVKLASDKEIQVNLSTEGSKKLKVEVEDCKKKKDVHQLISEDRVTSKELEYHSLLATLLDKVKNLEEQIIEQRRGINYFEQQNNILKEQNGIIPTLQTSQDILQRQLLQNLQELEKVKIDYHLLKLEKEKYYALNEAKDREIQWFHEEIRNVQLLIETQMKDFRKVSELETSADKAENLISLIDGQAYIIRSKLGSIRLGEELSTSNNSFANQKILNNKESSPKSALTTTVLVSPPAFELDENSTNKPFNQNVLKVPEL